MTTSPGRAARWGLSVSGVLIVIGAWQLAVEGGLISELTVPAPTVVLPRVLELVSSGDFRSSLADTLATWLIAMTLMVMIMVPVGLVVGSIPAARRPTAGLVHVLRSIPSTALIPVAILFFGLGIRMKAAVTCYAVAWPLLLNSIYGAQSVDPEARVAARSLRLGAWESFRHLTLRSASRYIGTGVRLGGGIGFVVILGAELLGASSGVGTLIVRYQQAELRDKVLAGIIVIGTIGVIMYQLLELVERRLSPWAPEHRDA